MYSLKVHASAEAAEEHPSTLAGTFDPGAAGNEFRLGSVVRLKFCAKTHN